MAKVKKSNRVLTVDENAVEAYLKQGYDKVDDKGKVLKKAIAGKSVSAAEHNKVIEENDKLKEDLKKAKADLTAAKK
ncbi:hypothetical protein [Paenisporosarcina sp. TG-14]|uniref:hypothetical protein n=1 Tax=Paenisporosarcina sp. TG-14 TaxID=1231057 RepID=UPI0002EB9E33|nr:hypothetical protein [Paenisporosarcina sp. TG-14]